mmetsp:Transcript_15379/g.17410  ORF Transcript_15379/g.17410 Transcript_15379/m.17410 type:complete len:234 (+) Transcript_15379:341-1042(+)|eukprot:CAMPEP_0184029536 /NCGR_PEP_ID=MMETSP0955-20130417/601_1 /TAXON_ID=627963 /ORGANISM="Aplanochytrium sp, Strain PBS07" /LENGTH=233 /DNA_ID=CAMNT_0026314625 /DNA_START=267 /DNA_END=968 /DNA_ORIENTATION=+
MCKKCRISMLATRFNNVCQQSLKTLQLQGCNRSLRQDLEPVFKLASEITLEDIGSREKFKPKNSLVSYYPIVSEREYEMGVFVVPPGGKIPLHDHPDMCVISKVLSGEMRMISMDWDRENEKEPLRQIDGTKRAVVKENRVLVPGEMDILLPDHHNLHEIRACDKTGAVFLDILTPKYSSDEGRECQHYEIQDDYTNCNNKRHRQHRMQTVSPVIEKCVGDKVNLVSIPQPVY